jgi:exodeoxyribonuclease V gamma subunit
MAGLHIYHSNRMERLVDQLAEIVSQPLPDPLVPEIIIIQSQGMEKWLSQELSLRLGVWANPSFPFPQKFTEELLKQVSPEGFQSGKFTPEFMTWRLLSLIAEKPRQAGFEALYNYLGNDSSTLRLYQLSGAISRVFDQYMVYRPEMLLDWESGRDKGWQPELWRLLVSGTPGIHRTSTFRQFVAMAHSGCLKRPGISARVSLFGISSLPPLYLDLLSALSIESDVFLFFLNPCHEYWGDQLSEKEKGRQLGRMGAERLQLEEDYFKTAQPLLASWGKTGRDFLNLLIDRGAGQDDFLYEEPGDRSLLHLLQSDLLHLKDRSDGQARQLLDKHDRSLQIHNCHSPLREMEVLQDHLWEMFEQLEGLRPQDVMVLTPDIEKYAPFIHAVFGGAKPDRERIPYTVSDRRSRQESLIAVAFLKILELTHGRFEASQILALLDFSPIRRHFGLEASDMEKIHRWIKATGIQWGWDAAERQRVGLPGFAENSWQFGMDRLFLGFVMQGEQPYQQILPFPDLEGSQSLLLGRFSEFLHCLIRTTRQLQQPRSLDEWRIVLTGILDDFFALDDTLEAEAQLIRGLLEDLSRFQTQTDCRVPLDLQTLQDHLEQALNSLSLGRLFLAGGVTFCALRPMRSIPARVIAMVGMNHDQFPRLDPQAGFDLMRLNPQMGDRSLREEDRELFLETMISARDRLFLSYSGQNLRDNNEALPSVCIDELLDYVRKGFSPPPGVLSTDDFLIVRHKLQPFSPAYFIKQPPFFSYSGENYSALQARINSSWRPAPFINQPMGEPGLEWKIIPLNHLLRFFRAPVEFFLKNRIGIELGQDAEFLEDREPFELRPLEGYGLKEKIMEKWPDISDERLLFELFRQEGELPIGTPGEVALGNLQRKIHSLKARISRYQAGPSFPQLEVDLGCEDFKLRGVLGNCWRSGRLRYRPAKIQPKDRMAAWIEHLVLNVLAPREYSRKTVLAGEDRDVGYREVAEPLNALQSLLQWYWRGLQSPLPFFPEVSIPFMEALKKGESESKAIEAARTIWEKEEYMYETPKTRPYNDLAFGAWDPFDEQFIQVSCEIAGPLLEHEVKIDD